MGFSYDWDRTVVAVARYYRWGQWIFLRFWEAQDCGRAS